LDISMLLQKIAKYIKNPLLIFFYLGYKGFLNWLPDTVYLKIMFRAKCSYSLDLKNPKTFNEKLQWLKLYNRNPLYTWLADKYEVRKFIAEKIGDEYLIPLLGVWDSVDEIDFEKLPNQFVLKCNHDSGSVIICNDKNNFNVEKTKEKLRKNLKRNYYWLGREYPYKNIKPRIICEKYMVDESGTELKDYKFFCFNGEPKIIQVNYNRSIDHRLNFYDTKFNYVHIQLKPHLTNPNKLIDKPSNLDKMLILAKTLSKDYPFVRVDFYSINDKVYFGELTFTPNSGYKEFKPAEFNFEMGSWLELPL